MLMLVCCMWCHPLVGSQLFDQCQPLFFFPFRLSIFPRNSEFPGCIPLRVTISLAGRQCYELRRMRRWAQIDEGSRVTGEGRQWIQLLEALAGLWNRRGLYSENVVLHAASRKKLSGGPEGRRGT